MDSEENSYSGLDEELKNETRFGPPSPHENIGYTFIVGVHVQWQKHNSHRSRGSEREWQVGGRKESKSIGLEIDDGETPFTGTIDVNQKVYTRLLSGNRKTHVLFVVVTHWKIKENKDLPNVLLFQPFRPPVRFKMQIKKWKSTINETLLFKKKQTKFVVSRSLIRFHTNLRNNLVPSCIKKKKKKKRAPTTRYLFPLRTPSIFPYFLSNRKTIRDDRGPMYSISRLSVILCSYLVDGGKEGVDTQGVVGQYTDDFER